MNIFTKKFKVLGRSKIIILISDAIFLLIIAFALNYYTTFQAQKLDFKPIIIDTINQISNKNKDEETIIKNPEEIKCSEIKIKSYALYYNKSGDQIGIGPVPPIVGIPTNYWVFFEIQNGNNNLKNVNLYASLSNNINFTGNKNIKYGNFIINSNKQVNWSINDIEKNQIIKIAFEVSLIPNQKNIGKILNITQDTKIVATDEICKKQISINIEDLDTNLKYDSKVKNLGTIQK